MHAGIPHPLLGADPLQQAHESRHHPPPPPRSRHTPRSRDPLRSACWEKRSTSGRYASYWNAILFHHTFWKVICFIFLDKIFETMDIPTKGVLLHLLLNNSGSIGINFQKLIKCNFKFISNFFYKFRTNHFDISNVFGSRRIIKNLVVVRYRVQCRFMSKIDLFEN